ncbi:putative baseplate assembly protein [Tunturibacter psychrotolerans]|uniref:Baseplate assembly protein n=1 Tax=Tunturiibacter psychrotolerans TaxID=3069686 RepID=A0AAU7ZRP8_9BACT
MPLPEINLDDRTFEQLYQELIRRIPAYTPEWTDLNDSDPGVTLVQLFAWLAEILVYRINQVPQKNFIKFLELVGIPLTAPSPAVTELQFTLVPKASATSVLAGTQVALGSGSSGQQVVFETDFDLLVTGLTLVSVQSYNGLQFTDYTAANALYASLGYPPLSVTPQANAALYLGFDNTFPAGTNRLTIHVAQGPTPAPVQGGVGTPTLAAPSVEANWQYWNGQWTQLQVQNDTTSALTKSGYVTFTAPTDGQLQQFGLLTKPGDQPLFWIRYFIQSLVGSGYDNVPMLSGILLDTVSATNSVTETAELLGASNGRPNQTFQLANFPILSGTIAVDDGNGYAPWTEVDDFDGYTAMSQVYTLDDATGLVTFGDGIHGGIPPRLPGNGSNLDSADQTNVMATTYKWGGGAAANSGANTITTLLASIPNLQGVSNPLPSYGGADEESVQDAEDSAPMILRTQNRAVTVSDFAFLATQTPGAQIKRAQAFPLLNPNFRVLSSVIDGSPRVEVPIPGAVTVFVIPDSLQLPPVPSENTLQLVANYLDARRLLTCELYVAPPHYRQVRIEVQVVANPAFDLGTVGDAVLKQLLVYFNPLPPGGANKTGWDFGGTIYFAETYRQIFNVTGVLLIKGTLQTYVDSVLQTPCTDVSIMPDEIVYSANHGVIVTYS